MAKRIGIIDSGMGGDYIRDSLLEMNPELDILQHRPVVFSPYGNMPLERLFIQADIHMEFLLNEQVDAIIVGCMTLSVNCLNFIKYKSKCSVKIYDLYTALPHLEPSETVVLATNNTIRSNAFEGCLKIGCHHLANAIETGCSDRLIEGLLRGLLTGHVIGNRSTVVAGCSHYSWIKEDIQAVMNPQRIIDPSDHLLKQLEKEL